MTVSPQKEEVGAGASGGPGRTLLTQAALSRTSFPPNVASLGRLQQLQPNPLSRRAMSVPNSPGTSLDGGSVASGQSPAPGSRLHSVRRAALDLSPEHASRDAELPSSHSLAPRSRQRNLVLNGHGQRLQ